MKIGSLFSGAGGLDLAVEQFFNGKTVWQCEFDADASKVLAAHWRVPNHGDVKQVDWSSVEPVDVLCGGYPCQPFSAAGERKGAEDDRHMWPYFAEAIRVIRPRFVVLENVAGHRSMGFDSVQADLAQARYDSRWTSLRARDVGAPHFRDRLFVLASDSDFDRLEAGGCAGGSAPEIASDNGCFLPLPDEVWGRYLSVVRRWESVMGPAPDPVVSRESGRNGLNIEFLEWMMGLPSGWVTGVSGLSRAAQIKILGNGVVPKQALSALRILSSLKEPV